MEVKNGYTERIFIATSISTCPWCTPGIFDIFQEKTKSIFCQRTYRRDVYVFPYTVNPDRNNNGSKTDQLFNRRKSNKQLDGVVVGVICYTLDCFFPLTIRKKNNKKRSVYYGKNNISCRIVYVSPPSFY
ncbi:MAG: hypothetical protein WC415_02510 [Patescibacteria group bacterium]